MAETVYLELEPSAVAIIRTLSSRFNETSLEAMVSRALGLLEDLAPFIRGGILTVVDPRATSDDPEERYVDFVFENIKPDPSGREAG